MSVQWTLITWFLYAEVAAVLLMYLPIFSVQRWRRILRSRLLRKLDAWINVYFNAFLVLLALLLWDAWRKWSQHSSDTHGLDEKVHPHGFALNRMRKYRSQYNFTIVCGALLLWLMLRWMVGMLIGRAFVEEDLRSEQKRADGAVKAESAELADLQAQLKASRAEIAELRSRLPDVSDGHSPGDKKGN